MKNSGCVVGDMSLLTQNQENQTINKFWTLVYIRRGIGMYLLGSHLKGLNEGDLLFFPPRLEYSFSSADLGDEYNINVDASVLQFDDSWLEALLGVFHGMSDLVLRIKEMRSAMFVSGLKWMSVSTLMNDLTGCGLPSQPYKILKILELVSDGKDMLPLTDPVPSDKSVSDRLARIERYIDCNVYRKISLDEISKYAGMNRSYFSLFFKKHFKTGLTEYINMKKVAIAAAMLAHSDRPISDIAVECGFSNVTYFNRIFKTFMQMSPGRYRSEHKTI